MLQERLNSLLTLAIYHEELDSLNIKRLVNEFIVRGDERRLNAFAMTD